ncbi:hypothetical protein LCGC14_1341270 [marine sediment metagenome]|uniref:Uncharacterized protein n=1 Tax=marine sediment metagenome TaxID=412755 RepID=A0A0F9KEE9_9ZZZZ
MVFQGTGTLEQLVPLEEQIVDGEPQIPSRPSSPLIVVAQPEKRMTPLPVTPRPPLPTAEEIAQQQATQLIYGGPVLEINRYEGTDQEFRELIRWDIPVGFSGDLHEISLLSDNDAKTRYRIVIGNQRQNVPEDRQTSTPLAFSWDRGVIPGGTSCWVEVRTTDGTSIIVDGVMTGTVR